MPTRSTTLFARSDHSNFSLASMRQTRCRWGVVSEGRVAGEPRATGARLLLRGAGLEEGVEPIHEAPARLEAWQGISHLLLGLPVVYVPGVLLLHDQVDVLHDQLPPLVRLALAAPLLRPAAGVGAPSAPAPGRTANASSRHSGLGTRRRSPAARPPAGRRCLAPCGYLRPCASPSSGSAGKAGTWE